MQELTSLKDPLTSPELFLELARRSQAFTRPLSGKLISAGKPLLRD